MSDTREPTCVDCGQPAGSAAGPIIQRGHLDWHWPCWERRLRDDAPLIERDLTAAGRQQGLLAWTGETGSRVTLAEEPGGCERVASITFSSDDESESWGEFLTWTEALALRSWLDLLLARAGRD